MKKIRFVIADSSETFALDIQEKLESRIGGNVSEILIITDKGYLDEFFSSDQKMDVLLIDKKFYSEAIEKHNINLICIVSDNPDDSNRPNTGFVYTLNRNSGTDKISQIMLSAINPAFLEKKVSDGDECKVILVTSPLGGSGKTVVSAAIAHNLRKSGMRVLFVDTTSLQSSSHWITEENKIDDYYILDNFNAECIDNITVHGNIDHIALFSQVLAAFDLNMGNYYELIKSEKKSGKYDYIVVDSESCFSTDMVNFMTLADNVVILTLQDEVAAKKMQRFLYNFDCSDKSKYMTCCSKFCIDKKNYLNEKADFYIPMINLNGAQLSEISKMQCINSIASMLL